LHYQVTADFAEVGETYSSEVRLFTTPLTNIPLLPDPPAGDAIAALTGDGGAHTAIGTISLIHGVTGSFSLTFSPAGLAALQTAINGPDATIGIAFREFAGNDSLDEFILGQPNNHPMTIDVAAAIPEPNVLIAWSVLSVFGMGVRLRTILSECDPI
jgi:hypothetical protein